MIWGYNHIKVIYKYVYRNSHLININGGIMDMSWEYHGTQSGQIIVTSQ